MGTRQSAAAPFKIRDYYYIRINGLYKHPQEKKNEEKNERRKEKREIWAHLKIDECYSTIIVDNDERRRLLFI
jgi:hypothetical protein